MIQGIERLDEKRIRIGSKEFRLGIADHPLPDGTYMGVEAAGRPYTERQQQFDLELFQGTQANQLFKGLYIGIYSPIVESKNISYIELANPYGNPTLCLSLSFEYAGWTGESNLVHLGKRLSQTFLKEIPSCTSATSKAADVAVDISLKIDIPRSEDLYEFVRAIDQKVNDEIRRATTLPNADGAVAGDLKPDEHGYKWWVRYVLIPLLGSAAVVAVVQLIRAQA